MQGENLLPFSLYTNDPVTIETNILHHDEHMV